MFDSLAHNTHLRSFACNISNGLSDKLVLERLMPALRVNRSVRNLQLLWHREGMGYQAQHTPAMRSAMNLVAARANMAAPIAQ